MGVVQAATRRPERGAIIPGPSRDSVIPGPRRDSVIPGPDRDCIIPGTSKAPGDDASRRRSPAWTPDRSKTSQ